MKADTDIKLTIPQVIRQFCPDLDPSMPHKWRERGVWRPEIEGRGARGCQCSPADIVVLLVVRRLTALGVRFTKHEPVGFTMNPSEPRIEAMFERDRRGAQKFLEAVDFNAWLMYRMQTATSYVWDRAGHKRDAEEPIRHRRGIIAYFEAGRLDEYPEYMKQRPNILSFTYINLREIYDHVVETLEKP